MPRFLLTHQERSRHFDLKEGDEALVGRSLEAKFFLSAPSISRRHCVLRASELGVEVANLSSSQQCFVNGRRVINPVLLNDGSMLQIGGLSFKVSFLDKQQATCSRCEKNFPSEEMQAVEGQGAVCMACLASTWDEVSGRLEGALRSHGFRVIEGLGGSPPALKVESGIGKILMVLGLPLHKNQDPGAVQRVREAARSLARLAHEAIVPLYDIRESPGFLLLVMGYQEGESLEETVRRDGPLRPEKAVAVARTCLEALVHAEERGVLHQDLRPAHVTLTPSGRVRISGFSISSELGSLSFTVTNAGSSANLAFLAPELFSDGDAASPRTDLYGVGTVLYFALTGRPPYPDLSPAEFVWNVGLGDTPKLKLDDVPPHLGTFLETLLALDAEKRPPNARAALDMLDRLQAESLSRGTLEGGFKGDELIEFLQLIEFHRKTGALSVLAPELVGKLTFREGSLATAQEASGLQGLAAARVILSYRKGRFRFEPGEAESVDPGLNVRVSALLLDIARTVDESGEDWSALKGS